MNRIRVCILFVLVAILGLTALDHTAAAAPPRRPNVVLIVTDDQGYGDLGFTGNPILKTPNLDRLASESLRLVDFHVDPTCSPTRAALMTGRYSTRVGVWHTVMGRHMPRADERLMPEYFAAGGYATGIFGKWHLGDAFPFRPQDRGFQKSVVHGGGGIGQIPDAWGNDYFDDTYLVDGKPQPFTGYCTDVFFDQALRFIESAAAEPFFVYLATNAPHDPLRVPDEWAAPYRAPEHRGQVDEDLAKFYGMIANIDHNVGRLRKRLDKLSLAKDTLLIFMTDNGTARGAVFGDYRGNDLPLKAGYNAGMRGRKGSPYEGGHRVPCLVHWPRGGFVDCDVHGLTAHVDLLPTLLGLCGLSEKQGTYYDGRNLREVLAGTKEVDPERILITHHQELRDPEKYRFASVMQGPWRLIVRNDPPAAAGAPPASRQTVSMSGPPRFELYDVKTDPGQTRDLAADELQRVAALRAAYEAYWNQMSWGFDKPAEIVIGDERAPVVELTCFERLGSQQWGQQAVRRGFAAQGPWLVRAVRTGKYEITLRRWPAELGLPIRAGIEAAGPEKGEAIPVTQVHLNIGDHARRQPVDATMKSARFNVELEAGSHALESTFTGENGIARGVYYATIRRLRD
jgi:arylsulfatase A-like enzyme